MNSRHLHFLFARLREMIRSNMVEPYFCFFSRLYLNRWRPSVIVITGSSGKTSLLFMLKELFGDRACYSERSNTKMGVSLHALGLPAITRSSQRWRWLAWPILMPFKALFGKVRAERFYLVEYDVSNVYARRFFKWWLQPDICLWTSISPSHLESFDNVAKRQNKDAFAVAIEHFASVVGSAQRRIFALGRNQIMRQALQTTTPISWLNEELLDYKVSLKKTIFKFADGQFVFSQPLPQIAAKNLILARALAAYCRLPIRFDWRNWTTAPGRNSCLPGYGGSYILDSSYNAQLEAVIAMLRMFKKIHVGTKWLVCGDMIEQGKGTAEFHHHLAKEILALNPKRIFLVGPRTGEYVYPILKNHQKPVDWFPKISKELLTLIKSEIAGSEVILFKGAGHLDILVEALLLNPQDSQFLNRAGRAHLLN